MKRGLAFLLALILALGSVPAQALSGTGARDTGFFTPRTHTSLHYSDITYRYTDPAPILREIAALEKLCAHASNQAAFRSRFSAMYKKVQQLTAMLALLDIRTYADASDEANHAAYSKAMEDYLEVADAFNRLVRSALCSPCAPVLASQMSASVQNEYLDYQDLSAEQKKLVSRNAALENEYQARIVKPFTYTCNGAEYTSADAYFAYLTGKIDHAAYDRITAGIAERQNSTLGGIYLNMVSVRNAIARSYGYDDYAAYAYQEIYKRDYSLDDIRAFRSAVKQYLVPLASSMRRYAASFVTINESDLRRDVAYTGADVFDTLRPYFAALSDELLESMDYISSHGCYDLDPGRNKNGTAFTITLPGYEAPFFFNNAYGSHQDLITSIHELGHVNAAYWKSSGWNDPSLPADVAEVHSQALELLMLRYYGDLFGEKAAGDVAFSTAFNIVYSGIILGCLHDELQQYAYATKGVTLTQLNRKYRQLAEEYGLIDADDPRTEMYGWVDISHTFTSPMYYISYATSAAGAFAFWEESRSNYFGAVDHYLRFTAQSNGLGFQGSFAGAGMISPLSGQYVRRLSSVIHEGVMKVAPYTDVYLDDWYGGAVKSMLSGRLMNGTSGSTFSPAGTANREQAMTVIARMSGSRPSASNPYTIEEGIAWAVKSGISDGTDPKGTLTREQFVTMLYRLSGSPDSRFRLDFPDAGQISAWALSAMKWGVETGLIEGYGDGALHPSDTLQRAQMAAILMRYSRQS